MLYFGEALRGENRRRADGIEAAALGYGGGKATGRFIEKLRGE